MKKKYVFLIFLLIIAGIWFIYPVFTLTHHTNSEKIAVYHELREIQLLLKMALKANEIASSNSSDIIEVPWKGGVLILTNNILHVASSSSMDISLYKAPILLYVPSDGVLNYRLYADGFIEIFEKSGRGLPRSGLSGSESQEKGKDKF